MSWEQKRLDELGTISRGRSKHRPRNDPSLFNGEYPFIQTADVKNANFYITEYSQSYNDKGLSQSKLWKKGTLCITIAANIADSGILGIDACFPDSIMGFVPYEDKSDVRYVKYCFDILQNECQQISQGATQDNLSWEKLSTIKFPAPSLETQKRIADILSTYDDLIENNQKQIKLLEEAAQRLYKEWFVDLRFPGYENTPTTDGIPEGWSLTSILDNNIFDFVKCKMTPFEGNKIYYATADVSGTSIVSAGEKILYENKPSRASVLPVPFSVWFARMSNSYKILNCFGANSWLADSAVLSSGFAGFTSLKEYYGFVYETIASKYFDEEKNRYATGATQVSLTNEGLSKIKILLPTVDIIRKYSKTIEPIMSKSELLKSENYKLKEARDRLLPKLMNGEIEV
ncbi:MAG: restriction endonuclease subunit S [Clostridia bacterium]|nr:restriction endonuclease subunit S [Clostridia bacterium]